MLYTFTSYSTFYELYISLLQGTIGGEHALTL